jgi:preprotein translocase subunit YajC
MLSNLKSGDKVITNGGIYGKVVGLDGDTLLLQVAEQVRIKIARSAVAGMQAEPKESS